MFKNFFSFFKNLKPETWPIIRTIDEAIQPPKPPEPVTDKELAALLEFVIWNFHGFTNKSTYNWSKISPVKVSTTFSGWGYVDGRTSALKINKRISICEADEDMDFSEFCVLVDNVASMILYSGRRGPLMLSIVGESTTDPEALANWGRYDIATVERFRRMAMPYQAILVDVFRELYLQSGNKPDPIEKVLDYSMGDNRG